MGDSWLCGWFLVSIYMANLIHVFKKVYLGLVYPLPIFYSNHTYVSHHCM